MIDSQQSPIDHRRQGQKPDRRSYENRASAAYVPERKDIAPRLLRNPARLFFLLLFVLAWSMHVASVRFLIRTSDPPDGVVAVGPSAGQPRRAGKVARWTRPVTDFDLRHVALSKNGCDQLAATPNSGLVEDRLQVVLDRVLGNVETV